MQLQRLYQKGSLIAALSLTALTGCGDDDEPAFAVAAAAGAAHTCALDDSGRVWCWGVSGAIVPTAVDGLPEVTQLAAGLGHTCAVTTAGEVFCWGSGERGQLGGDTETRATPAAVPGIGDAVQVACGDLHTCVRHADGGVSCFGDNTTAQLGVSASDQPTPNPTRVFEGATHIAAGGIDSVAQSCAIDEGGGVTCWGRLDATPTPTGISMAVTADVGANHLCAITRPDSNGATIACVDAFADDAIAMLGDASLSAVGAGGLHTCVVEDGGAVWCFGDDLDGQLGDGDGDATNMAVRALEGGAVSVTAGLLHSCAVMQDGGMRCWGENNNGRLGVGETGAPIRAPRAVVGFTPP